MPHLSPPTLTHDRQEALLRATRRNSRDHLIYSLALRTGLQILAKTPDPREEVAAVKAELATIEAEANRILDIATPANRDFVDERLGKIRPRKQELEARLTDLARVDYQPVDLEAATSEAFAHLGKIPRGAGGRAPSSSGGSFYVASCTKSPSIPTLPEARSPSTNCR